MRRAQDGYASGSMESESRGSVSEGSDESDDESSTDSDDDDDEEEEVTREEEQEETDGSVA